jgi:hypothetical protein
MIVRNWPEAGVATLHLGTSAVDVTSDVPVTESDWPPNDFEKRLI